MCWSKWRSDCMLLDRAVREECQVSRVAACDGLADAVHRGQEFVELVRQERMLEAIAYSRQHLSPWSDLYQADLQRALAALAFRAGAPCLAISRLRCQRAACCSPCRGPSTCFWCIPPAVRHLLYRTLVSHSARCMEVALAHLAFESILLPESDCFSHRLAVCARQAVSGRAQRTMSSRGRTARMPAVDALNALALTRCT